MPDFQNSLAARKDKISNKDMHKNFHHTSNVLLLPCEMQYSLLLHGQQHVPCSTKQPTYASSVHRHFEHTRY